MQGDIKFLKGLQANYDALETKVATTFYYTTDTGRLYLGDKCISGKNSFNWDEIESKPFEEELQPLFDIKWDGKTVTGVSMDVGEGLSINFISSDVYTPEELIGGTIHYSDGYVIGPLTANEIVSYDEDGMIMVGNDITVIYDEEKASVVMGMNFPNGIYFYSFSGNQDANYNDAWYVAHFVAGQQVSKIESKYLPNDVAKKSDIPKLLPLEWKVIGGK